MLVLVHIYNIYICACTETSFSTHVLLSCTSFKDRVFLTNYRARKLLALFAKGVAGHGMDPTMFQEMLLEIARTGLKDLHAFLGE